MIARRVTAFITLATLAGQLLGGLLLLGGRQVLALVAIALTIALVEILASAARTGGGTSELPRIAFTAAGATALGALLLPLAQLDIIRGLPGIGLAVAAIVGVALLYAHERPD